VPSLLRPWLEIEVLPHSSKAVGWVLTTLVAMM
jgi:hypothetical protein